LRWPWPSTSSGARSLATSVRTADVRGVKPQPLASSLRP
jgi:hypothetical protein